MKNEKFNETLHNALQVQKEMEKRENLYQALALIKDACTEYSTCDQCPLFAENEISFCGLDVKAPQDWELKEDTWRLFGRE